MSDFYPFYLGEHTNAWTKLFHVVGTLSFLGLTGLAFYWDRYSLILLGIVVAYGFAWFSHFAIEKNRPATFKNPFLSLRSDFKMTGEIVTGKRKLKDDSSDETSSDS